MPVLNRIQIGAIRLFACLSKRCLIRRALKTPYNHIEGYLYRWWLVPYKEPTRTLTSWMRQPDTPSGDGTGPVSWCRPIAKLFQHFDIAVRVHHILRSDLGRDPHDHPWDFITVILKGGYYEKRYTAAGTLKSVEWHGVGSVLIRRATDFHKLTLPKDETAWTLFITGRKRQTWGFKPMNAPKVPHNNYIDEN